MSLRHTRRRRRAGLGFEEFPEGIASPAKRARNSVAWFSARPTQKSILTPKGVAIVFTAGLGFEPRYIASEATVLPLDDPALFSVHCSLLTVRYTSKCFLIATALAMTPSRIPIANCPRRINEKFFRK